MEDFDIVAKKFKLCSVISMVCGVLTVFLAVMYAFGSWSIWPALICAIVTLLVNGLAKTYEEALIAAKKESTDYGDPTARD